MTLNSTIDPNQLKPETRNTLRAILVVSPDGTIQFATARAENWIRDLFAAVSPLNPLPEALARWPSHSASGHASRVALEKPEGSLTVQQLFHEPGSVCLLLEWSEQSQLSAAECSCL